jgi:hypothetical protein
VIWARCGMTSPPLYTSRLCHVPRCIVGNSCVGMTLSTDVGFSEWNPLIQGAVCRMCQCEVRPRRPERVRDFVVLESVCSWTGQVTIAANGSCIVADDHNQIGGEQVSHSTLLDRKWTRRYRDRVEPAHARSYLMQKKFGG